MGTGDRARWAGGAVCAGQRVGHGSLTPGPCREQAVGTGRQPCRQLSSSCGAEPGQAGLGGGSHGESLLNRYGAFSGVMYGNQVEGGGCIDREHTKCH